VWTVLSRGPQRVVVMMAVLAVAGEAIAQVSTSREGGVRPSYDLELEPQLLLGVAAPDGTSTGAGIGVRGSWQLDTEGLSSRLDDSVAFTLGFAFVHYPGRGGVYDRCLRWVPTPAGTMTCTELPGTPRNQVLAPLQGQWNVWLAPRWSFLAEPGLALYVANGRVGVTPAIAVGGRYQVRGALAIALRIGWPITSVGASFQF